MAVAAGAPRAARRCLPRGRSARFLDGVRHTRATLPLSLARLRTRVCLAELRPALCGPSNLCSAAPLPWASPGPGLPRARGYLQLSENRGHQSQTSLRSPEALHAVGEPFWGLRPCRGRTRSTAAVTPGDASPLSARSPSAWEGAEGEEDCSPTGRQGHSGLTPRPWG